MNLSDGMVGSVVFLLLAALSGTFASGAEDDNRIPVPDAASIQAAENLVRDVFGKEHSAAKSTADKAALAKKILAAAMQPANTPAQQFVLFRVARDIAISAADAETAFKAVEGMDRRFRVNSLEMQVAALESIAGRVRLPSHHKALLRYFGTAFDQALAADRFDDARHVQKLAMASAVKTRDVASRKKAVAWLKELVGLEKKFAAVQEASAVLDERPDDPEANLAVGKYRCFIKGGWEAGLPMLALGNDEVLAALALSELAPPEDPREQVELADGWWEQAQAAEGREKDAMRLRARRWYEAAAPNLTGLEEAKVKNRLREIADSGRVVVAVGRSLRTAVAPFDEKTAKELQEAWAKHLGVPVVETNSLGMKLVLIPPGEFDMGFSQEQIKLAIARAPSLPDYYRARLPASVPRHRVKITQPFYLGLCEVTQAEYLQVTGTNPSKFKDAGTVAVHSVTWNEAAEFCRRLSTLPKERAARRVYQLPSEAQWEYACRAGTTTVFYFGDDDGVLGAHTWFADNSGGRVRPVGRKAPNAWGLFDMLGNASEWCTDWFGNDYYRQSPRENPPGPAAGEERVWRGGTAGIGYRVGLSCGYRNDGLPDHRADYSGFRVMVPLGR